MDLKDKRILYELDKDSSQSNKQIGKKVGASEQVVGNRIKNLQNQGIIEYFFVKTSPSILDYIHIKIYFRLNNLTKKKEEELLNELNLKQNIFWLASLRGKYDLVCSIYVRNIADFSKKYEELFYKWEEYIFEKNIIFLEKGFTFTKAYLIPGQESEKIIYSMEEEKNIQLDNIGRSILKILNKEGRISLIKMAHQLKVSSDTIRYRINNLKKAGVITGFGVKINFEKMNNSYYILLLKLQGMNLQKYKKLEKLSQQNKNIIVFLKTIGDHDIELEIIITNKQELDETIRELKENFVLEIKDYDLLEITKEHRMTYYPF